MFGIQHIQHRTVSLEEIDEEPDGLFVHVPPQSVKGREDLFALFSVRIKVTNAKPLTGKLGRQRTNSIGFEHPSSLCGQYIRLMQAVSCRQSQQFRIRGGCPQEIAQPTCQGPVIDGGDRCRLW